MIIASRALFLPSEAYPSSLTGQVAQIGTLISFNRMSIPRLCLHTEFLRKTGHEQVNSIRFSVFTITAHIRYLSSLKRSKCLHPFSLFWYSIKTLDVKRSLNFEEGRKNRLQAGMLRGCCSSVKFANAHWYAMVQILVVKVGDSAKISQFTDTGSRRWDQFLSNVSTHAQ